MKTTMIGVMIMKPSRSLVVYVSGKYSDSDEEKVIDNIKIAGGYASALWDMGYTVICPHTNSALFEQRGTCDWKGFMGGYLELVKRCDVLFAIPNWKDSPGARKEVAMAVKLNKHIFFNLEDMCEEDGN